MDANVLRTQLEEKKRTLEKRLKNLQSEDPFEDTERLSDNAAIDTDARDGEGHERVEMLASELKASIHHIETVIHKIDTGTYGTCEHCHKPIDGSRLDVFPMAEYCLACEQKLERSSH